MGTKLRTANDSHELSLPLVSIPSHSLLQLVSYFPSFACLLQHFGRCLRIWKARYRHGVVVVAKTEMRHDSLNLAFANLCRSNGCQQKVKHNRKNKRKKYRKYCGGTSLLFIQFFRSSFLPTSFTRVSACGHSQRDKKGMRSGKKRGKVEKSRKAMQRGLEKGRRK